MTLDPSPSLERSEASVSPVSLSLAADRYRAYPGERIRLSLELTVAQGVGPITVALSLPGSLADAPPGERPDDPIDAIVVEDWGGAKLGVVAAQRALVWEVERAATATVRITNGAWPWKDDPHRLVFRCSASVGGQQVGFDSICVGVFRRADLVRFLPGLYQDTEPQLEPGQPARNDFLWRFLMLTERSWQPLESRIEQIWNYFDYTIAPEDMLAWLAWCLDLTFEEDWPVEKRREAVGQMADLYRRRGTKPGLQDMLELYVGECPEIVEHRGRKFKLGTGAKTGAKLGYNVALGKDARPHEFSVIFRRPLTEGQRTLAEKIIRADKPAHTGYEVQFATQSA